MVLGHFRDILHTCMWSTDSYRPCLESSRSLICAPNFIFTQGRSGFSRPGGLEHWFRWRRKMTGIVFGHQVIIYCHVLIVKNLRACILISIAIILIFSLETHRPNPIIRSQKEKRIDDQLTIKRAFYTLLGLVSSRIKDQAVCRAAIMGTPERNMARG